MTGLGRLRLAVLFLVIAAAALVACREAGTSLPVGTPGETSPLEAPVATTLPTERPIETVPAAAASPTERPKETAPAAAASPTERPAETPRAVAPPRQEAEGGSLRLISSRSASTPLSSPLGSAGNFSLSPSPQPAPVEGGLTVSAIGSVTVAADEAYVVIFPEQVYGPSGLQQMTGEDREEIREKLAELGVAEEDVEFESQGRYGSSSISVEVELGDLAEKSEPILEAVEEVIRRSEAHGVVYSLTPENCDRALSQARREAIPSVEKAADDLAEALGLERGTVIGALEYPLTNFGYGFSSLSGPDVHACGSLASQPYSNLVPLDAEPEVEVSVGLQVTYSIQ